MPALIPLVLSFLQAEGVSPPFTARVPSSASTYDQRGLAPGQEYQVTVRALRGTSWGPPASKTITTSEIWGRGQGPGRDLDLRGMAGNLSPTPIPPCSRKAEERGGVGTDLLEGKLKDQTPT